MKRIGILGDDMLTEKLVSGLFQAVPDAQVFLSPGNSERAQRLAREYPCWTLDNHQADLVKSSRVNMPHRENHLFC